MSNVEDRTDYGAFIPSFLDDFNLDMPCFRLYAHIARRAGSSLCWESIDKMATTCQMNRKTAYKAFKLLQDHKLILVEKRAGQTSLITLTNHSVWIPIPKQVQPKKVRVKQPPIPNQVQPPIPNQVQPPIPNQVHKGIPIEVTPDQGNPIEVTPMKEVEIYTAPCEIFSSSDLPKNQDLIDCMADQKENPIPPTPLTLLAPENVGLAITENTKPKKAKKQEYDLNLFLQVWNQDAPSHWVRHTKIDEATARKLTKFANQFENSLEMFQKGLWFAQTDKWSMKPERRLRMTNMLSRETNLIFQFYESYEDNHRRSQQSPLDRPMTPVENKMAHTYSMILEAIA